MPLRYTGRSSELTIGNKTYKRADGDFDKAIPISKRDALHLMEHSNLHSFEEVSSGEDLLESVTAPAGKDK